MADLSARGRKACTPALSYFSKHFAGMGNLYSRDRPDGFVLFSVAENRLTYPAAAAKLDELRGFRTASTGAYDNMAGRACLREALVHMLTDTCIGAAGAKHLSPDHLVVSSGCGALINNLALLLASEGDGVLLPTPTYGALYNDFSLVADVCVVDAPLDALKNYKLDPADLETAYLAAAARGVRIRILFLINPNNPLGTVHSAAEIGGAIAWARSRGLHTVVDEVYANSVYGGEIDGEGAFVSALDLCAEGLVPMLPYIGLAEVSGCVSTAAAAAAAAAGGGASVPAACASEGPSHPSAPSLGPLGTDVHVLWGLSKDFAMSGYRVGVLCSHNPTLLQAMGNIGYFCAVSNDTQDLLACMLRDRDWTRAFLEGNRATLRSCYHRLQVLLERHGLPYIPARAGMFVWLDMRGLLRLTEGAAAEGGKLRDAVTAAASAEFGSAPIDLSSLSTSTNPPSSLSAPAPPDFTLERQLTEELYRDCRILFTPGEACHASEQGWYRCCFAWMEGDALEVAFERLGKWIESRKRAQRGASGAGTKTAEADCAAAAASGTEAAQ